MPWAQVVVVGVRGGRGYALIAGGRGSGRGCGCDRVKVVAVLQCPYASAGGFIF